MSRSMAELRSAVRERDGCSRCLAPIDFALPPGSPAGPSLQHVIPVAAGGARRDMLNLLLSHGRCNKEKGAWHEGVDYAEQPRPRGPRSVPADFVPRRRRTDLDYFESLSAART